MRSDDTDISAELKRDLDQARRAARVIGVAFGITTPSETLTYVSGHQDVGQRHPITEDTPFQVVSVTKSMIATVIARMVAKGHLSLDDVISERVPELRSTEWARDTTMRNLLALDVGIPLQPSGQNPLYIARDPNAMRRLSEAVAKQPLLFTRGTSWGYSNTAWTLLGRVLEEQYGLPWETVLQQELLSPAGMDDSVFIDDIPPTNRWPAYEWVLDGQPSLAPDAALQRVQPWQPRSMGPAGGTLWSSLRDLLQFANLHLGTDSVAAYASPATIAALRRPARSIRIPDWMDAWCLGWARYDWPGGPVWGWDGVSFGFRCFLRFIPGRGALVMVANTGTARALYHAIFPQVLEERFGVQMLARDMEPDQHPRRSTLERFVGRFERPGTTAVVRHAGNRLAIAIGEKRMSGVPVDDTNLLIDRWNPDFPLLSFSEPGPDGRFDVLYYTLWRYARRKEPGTRRVALS